MKLYFNFISNLEEVRMANPAFSKKAFERIDSLSASEASTMTINGTIHRAGFLVLLMIFGAFFGWESQQFPLFIPALLGNFILGLVIIFKPKTASYLSQPYAFIEGILLGSISAIYASQYFGIVQNALIGTFTIFLSMLGLYHFKIIQVTDKIRSVVVAATMGIALLYLVDLILGFMGFPIPMIHQTSTTGIIFSIIVITVAAFNLLLDFDMIEKSEKSGSPKFMEWYSAFALVLTLVWLYLEILRLLSKVNKR